MWKYLPKQINNCLKRVDKTEDAYSEIDRTVKNFSCEKVILVFHSAVLKQPEDCKIFCKYATVFMTKPISVLVENYFCKLSARSSNNL